MGILFAADTAQACTLFCIGKKGCKNSSGFFHVVEVALFPTDDLVIFMAFAGNKDYVAWPGIGKNPPIASRRSGSTIAFSRPSGEKPCRIWSMTSAGSSVRGLSLVT